MRFGYLVPEFPGQTHAFFWREVAALSAFGADVDLLSTRRPAAGVRSHDWTAVAEARTTYLDHPSPGMVLCALPLLVRWTLTGKAVAAWRSLVDLSPARRAAVILSGALVAARARQSHWNHLHAHSAGSSALIAWAASTMPGGPTYSITLHGPLSDYGGAQRLKWSNASFGLIITRSLTADAQVELGDALPATIALAPMGVDTDLLHRTSPPPVRGSDEPLIIFSCGRLNPAKGHDTLIAAVGALRKKGVTARLVIAGEDDDGGSGYRRVLEQLMVDLGLGDSVTLLGAVSEDRVRSELERSHVFVLASHAEPLGVAVMEAMAMEVPVVVGDGGGVRELVTPGETGILFTPGEVPALVEALGEVRDRPDEAARRATAARRVVAERFSTQSSARVLAVLVSAQTGGDHVGR